MENENILQKHIFFMQKAYELAEKARELDEVPIGCVIEFNGEIIGSGYNRRNTEKNVLRHAEIIAIEEASKHINDWRLEDCTIYVTVEPCPMCAGAIVQARIKTLVYGTPNKKAGCAGSVLNLMDTPGFNHKVNVVFGVMEKECSEIMSDFFREFRGRMKNAAEQLPCGKE